MAEYRSAAGTRPLHRRTGGGRRRGAESVGQRAFPEGRQAQTSGRMRVRFFILLFLRFTHSIRRSSPIVGSWINWSHEISFEVHFSLFRHKLLADFLVFYIFWVFLLSNNITPFVFQWRSVTFLEQFSTDWQNYLFVYCTVLTSWTTTTTTKYLARNGVNGTVQQQSIWPGMGSKGQCHEKKGMIQGHAWMEKASQK